MFFVRLLILVVVIVTPTLEAAKKKFLIYPGSVVKLDGDSSIHAWTCETPKISGFAMIDPAFLVSKKPTSGQVFEISAKVPVKTLDCGSDAMNTRVYDTMEVAKHPNVTYTFSSTKIGKGEGKDKNDIVFETEGEFNIAGTDGTEVIKMYITPISKDKFRVKGSIEILMPEYDVFPPAIILGMFTVEDEVTISFDLVLKAE